MADTTGTSVGTSTRGGLASYKTLGQANNFFPCATAAPAVDASLSLLPGDTGIVARVRRAHAIGTLAKSVLNRQGNTQIIEALIPSTRFHRLQLKQGETLTLRLRRLRIFINDTAD